MLQQQISSSSRIWGVTLTELIPIVQDLESREVMVENRNESYRCGVEGHPIIISNDVPMENKLPIRIQVELPLPEDCAIPHLVSHQTAIHITYPIHLSQPCYIIEVGAQTTYSYQLAKALEYIK